MELTSQSYYVIVMVIKLDDKEKLYNIVINDRESAASVYDELGRGELSYIEKFTGKIDGASVFPFIFFEKTYISSDKIEEDEEDFSGVGSLSADSIPVDYVSEVIAFNNYKNLQLSEHIEDIIYTARFGFDEKQVAVL